MARKTLLLILWGALITGVVSGQEQNKIGYVNGFRLSAINVKFIILSKANIGNNVFCERSGIFIAWGEKSIRVLDQSNSSVQFKGGMVSVLNFMDSNGWEYISSPDAILDEHTKSFLFRKKS